ncbi:unnamed protein product [Nippostrongylus brasiliensis]|uniref:Secreted protein n=1 Tax=Nippostrongylus brasiliensis TaxID=27835 RepID=A0A0N4YGP4_NIPBR|nr:unnamed protein product [Nippostrongylus brasiliensis]
MFKSPLFFFVAVLLISDVAEAKAPQEFLRTVNTTKGLHELVEMTHYLTARAYQVLDGVSGSPGKAIALADKLVEGVLQSTRQQQKTHSKKILHMLAKALKAEVRALLKVMQRCLGRKKVENPYIKSIYDKARGYLESAVLYLIEAIVKSGIDGSKKTQIYKLRKAFINEDINNASKVTNHICALGENVAKVLNTY